MSDSSPSEVRLLSDFGRRKAGEGAVLNGGENGVWKLCRARYKFQFLGFVDYRAAGRKGKQISRISANGGELKEALLIVEKMLKLPL